MSSKMNEEEEVKCPIEDCNETALNRGLFMHIFQTDDPEGEGHYPRYSVPPDIDKEDVTVRGKKEVDAEYPDLENIEDSYYLDTYTGKAYEGKRGLMVHLGQQAGKNNIPEDVTEKHDADNFPIVDIDKNGNVTEVLKPVEGDVPPLEPYVPWYEGNNEDCIPRKRVERFIEDVRNSAAGAASPEAMERELLD